MAETLHPSISKGVHDLITAPFNGDITNRWLDGITNEQHHSMKAISASKIKAFDKMSPWRWMQTYLLNNTVSKFNDNFLIGTLIHIAVLEPEKFEKCVIVCSLDQRTLDFKDYVNEKFGTLIPKITPSIPKEIEGDVVENSNKKDKVEKSNKKDKVEKEEKPKYILNIGKDGQYIKDGEEFFLIKPEQMTMLRAIQKAVNNHKRSSILLSSSVPEISGIARCPVTGLFLNIRGDARGSDFFLDVKSCQDASESEVVKSIVNFGYGFQHAQYIETANLIEGAGTFKKFFFLFVSKEAPYEVALYHLDQEAIEYYTMKRMSILKRIKACQDSGKWEGADGVQHGKVLELPPWAFRN